MKANEIKDLFNSFENIAIEHDGEECRRARELYPLLGYENGIDSKMSLTRLKKHALMPVKISLTILPTPGKWLRFSQERESFFFS